MHGFLPSGVSWRTVDSYYGRATATLSVASSISSCTAYLRQYHANRQRRRVTHPFISTPYCVLAAPVTRESLDNMARWSSHGPTDPPSSLARQSTSCSRTFSGQPSSASSISTTATPLSPCPPPAPSTQATSPPFMRAFSSDSFDDLSSSSSNAKHDQAATLPPPSASELFEYLQPQPGEGLLLLISDYCGDGTLEELISRGGLRVAGPSAAGAARASSLLLSSSSNLLVVWESLLLLGQVTHGD